MLKLIEALAVRHDVNGHVAHGHALHARCITKSNSFTHHIEERLLGKAHVLGMSAQARGLVCRGGTPLPWGSR